MQHFFLLLFSFAAYSQDMYSIKGKITNSRTKEAVAFAHIIFENTKIGTVTNSHGEFELYIARATQVEKVSILISSIGYEKKKVTLPLYDYSNLQIGLEESFQQLKEVVVKYKDFPRSLVDSALKRIPKNYPTQTEVNEGFLREKASYDSTLKNPIWISEVTIKSIKSGYQKPKIGEVKMLKGRNYESPQIEKLTHKIYGQAEVAFEDPIYDREGIEDAVKSKNTTFLLQKTFLSKGMKTYLIKITHRKFSKTSVTLFIQDKTYAIIKAEQVSCCNLEIDETNYFFQVDEAHRFNQLMAGYRHSHVIGQVEYTKYNDSLWRNSYQYAHTKYNMQKDTIQSYFYDFFYSTTNTYPSDTVKIPYSERFFRSDILIDEAPKKYDSSFWKNYNTVKPTEEETNLFKSYTPKDTSAFKKSPHFTKLSPYRTLEKILRFMKRVRVEIGVSYYPIYSDPTILNYTASSFALNRSFSQNTHSFSFTNSIGYEIRKYCIIGLEGSGNFFTLSEALTNASENSNYIYVSYEKNMRRNKTKHPLYLNVKIKTGYRRLSYYLGKYETPIDFSANGTKITTEQMKVYTEKRSWNIAPAVQLSYEWRPTLRFFIEAAYTGLDIIKADGLLFKETSFFFPSSAFVNMNNEQLQKAGNYYNTPFYLSFGIIYKPIGK